MTSLNLHDIRDAVEALGVPATIDHTGGGIWTLFAGPTRHEEGWGDRSAAIAGPATSDSDRRLWIDTADFYVGPDDDGDTAADVYTADALGAVTVDQIAALIAAQARQGDPAVPLTAAQLDALGLDGTAGGRRNA